MLADINGFSGVMLENDNEKTTGFLAGFHNLMQDICDAHGAECIHESGDSFWVITDNADMAEKIAQGIVKDYRDYVHSFDEDDPVSDTTIRVAYTPAKVMHYDIGGQRHYNSLAHRLLRSKIESISTDQNIILGPKI